ncbi:hypothetical protein GCM10027343_15520 [Noviherbaspirillum agri]
MGIFTFNFPPEIAFLAILAATVFLYGNVRTAPWRQLAGPGAFSAWCALIIALPLLWRFDIPIAQGMALHMLGMPLFVLMYGRQLAMAGIAISALAFTVLENGLWSNLGMNLLLLAVLPAYCGDVVMRLTEKYFPRNVFVYLLGNGFFGTVLMLATIGLMSLGVHRMWITGTPPGGDVIAYMLLLSWGEAFLTGFLLTIFTVYRPEWVLTFDDEVYLRGK